MSVGLVTNALDAGAPVLAARRLLDLPPEHAGRVLLLDRLRRRVLRVSLPPDCPERPVLQALIGDDPGSSDPAPGVFCLAAHRQVAADGEDVFGSARRIRFYQGTSTPTDAFDSACEEGRRATIAWLCARLGVEFPELPPGMFQTSLLADDRICADRQGASAGLAAAIAYAQALLGVDRSRLRLVAAAGEVGPCGSVLAVDDIVVKVEALVRELPPADVLFVASGQADVPDLPGESPKVRRVKTVGEALDALYPETHPDMSARVDLGRAWQQARKHEWREERAEAAALARAIHDRVTQDPSAGDEVTRLKAALVARLILALDEVHAGSRSAVGAFDGMDRLLASERSDVTEAVMSLDFRVTIAVRRASALIDALRYDEAVSVCESLCSRISDMDSRPRVELLGTLARALAARGDLDRAEEVAGRQIGLALSWEEEAWRPRMQCNRLEVLYRRARAEPPGSALVARLGQSLEETERCNDALPDRAARRMNGRFLRLWRVRWLALAGRADEAVALAGPPPRGREGRFPDHYAHRFAAEALAAVGRVDEALRRLDAAADSTSEQCGEFERLILSTADAVSTVVRTKAALSDPDGRGARFLAALDAWAPAGFAPRRPDLDPQETAGVLRDVLPRLPY